jgi:hypothetical protein
MDKPTQLKPEGSLKDEQWMALLKPEQNPSERTPIHLLPKTS